MADAVVAKKLRDGNGRYAFLFGNASDGTGESAVTKVDISSLSGAPTKVRITRLIWACDGLEVKVLFDHDTDDLVAILAAHGDLNENQLGGMIDPASAGGSGDILFTTAGHTSGDGYTIYMECQKVA